MIIQKGDSLFIDTIDYKDIVLLFEKIKTGLDDITPVLKKTENSVQLIKTINNEIKRSFTDIESTKRNIREIISDNSK
ncbi:MAG: hypothetical protein CVU81_00275 [Euryarchaeota archaeon HGW-Euryarchaeota-1]|nr:MAG: hypothetical protein CVU81_00275 [Euryarchaeota archaeon HGW-Euryarchaeota-1]